MKDDFTALKMFPAVIEDQISIPMDWDYYEAIEATKNLFQMVRKNGIDIVLHFFYAHEILVKRYDRRNPKKTWYGFCKKVGIDPKTPLNWFNKYELEYTRVGGRKKKVNKEISLLKEQVKKTDSTKPVSKAVQTEILESVNMESTRKPRNTDIITSEKTQKKSEFQTLFDQIKDCELVLMNLANKSIVQNTSDDRSYFRSIIKAADNIILQYMRLDVDIEKICQDFKQSDLLDDSYKNEN